MNPNALPDLPNQLRTFDSEKKLRNVTKANIDKGVTPYAFDKKTPNFAQGLDFLRSQVLVCTVFQEESESEVEKCQSLESGGKK